MKVVIRPIFDTFLQMRTLNTNAQPMAVEKRINLVWNHHKGLYQDVERFRKCSCFKYQNISHSVKKRENSSKYLISGGTDIWGLFEKVNLKFSIFCTELMFLIRTIKDPKKLSPLKIGRCCYVGFIPYLSRLRNILYRVNVLNKNRNADILFIARTYSPTVPEKKDLCITFFPRSSVEILSQIVKSTKFEENLHKSYCTY